MPERNNSFREQARGLTRAFFLYLHESCGISLDEDTQINLINTSFVHLGNHIRLHRIYQNNIDGFKVCGFLSYYTAKHIASTTTHGATQDPVKECCRSGVEFLNKLLKLQSSSRYDLNHDDKAYLTSMLYAEAVNNCEIGIGANGLASIFSFVLKVNPKTTESILSKL